MQPRYYFAVEFDSNVPVKVHRFTLEPTTTQSNYRASVSYNAFVRFCNKIANASPEVRRFSVKHQEEMDSFLESWDRYYLLLPNPYRELKFVDYPSIWELYKSIGYDYKRSRLSDPRINK
jgi:hypothetical protein